MVGGSIAAIFAPMMACVTGWFDTHRSLAVSLVSAGMGMAPMTMSPLAAWLVSNHDWRTSMQIMAVVVACVMIPVSLLVRRPPALEAAHSAPAGDSAAQVGDVASAQALRSPQFIILLLTNFFCCATHSGPIIHTVSYAVSCGIPLIAAVTIYSVEGWRAWAAVSRSACSATASAPSACWCWGCSRRRSARSPTSSCASLPRSTRSPRVFGFIYAGTMPLYAVAGAREFSAADDGHRDRRHRDGRQPRHGDRAAGRRSDLRHLCQLRLALYRFLGVRPRRLPDRHDLQAVPGGESRTPSRLRREACGRLVNPLQVRATSLR